jgi:hypothetical protein
MPRADRLLPRPRIRERVLRDDPDELMDAPEPTSPEPTEPEGAEGPEEAAGAASPQVSQ